MSNKAKDIIIPKESGVFRFVFLYVGQGDSTLLVIPDGDRYTYVLIDSNSEADSAAIDVVKLLGDLFEGEDEGLGVYINTHPHRDHLASVRELYEKIGINRVWHSGHTPAGEHKEVYKDLEYVMKKVGEENVFRLRGSREMNKLDGREFFLGDVNFHVFAPADYVADEIEGEKAEARYARIHEQCGVLQFSYGVPEKQVLITGDADYAAWSEHITDYHRENLPSYVLSAAHHGSNSFFWKDSEAVDEEEPYKDHIDAIDPRYIVVSAPRESESRHEHPHRKAMELYQNKVGQYNLFHLGDKRTCVIVDIKKNGHIQLKEDDELVENYGGDTGKNESNSGNSSGSPVTKIDHKPFG